MKYLVTGGAGFIGSHLVEQLLGEGHEVTILDDLSTGSVGNLDLQMGLPGLRFVEGSVRDADVVMDLASECEQIVHLAAAVGVKLIMSKPLESFETNVKGTENVLNAALRYSVPVMVASTSEVYGKNTSDKLTEESDRVLGPTTIKRWSYAASKAFDEMLSLMMVEEKGLDATITRFFNTVGPRQSPSYGMVIPSLAKQAVAGEAMTVHGDGLQTRCFCHVQDTIAAVRLLLENESSRGEVFNIGRPDEISILDLATKIRSEADSDSLILTIPYEEAFPVGFEDMRRRVPGIDKIKAAVGWEPKVSMDGIVTDAVKDAFALRDNALTQI